MERWCALFFFLSLGFPTDGQPPLLAVARLRCEIFNSTHSSVVLPCLSFIFWYFNVGDFALLEFKSKCYFLFVTVEGNCMRLACAIAQICVWRAEVDLEGFADRRHSMQVFVVVAKTQFPPPKTVHGPWTFLSNPNWKKLCFSNGKATVTIGG